MGGYRALRQLFQESNLHLGQQGIVGEISKELPEDFEAGSGFGMVFLLFEQSTNLVDATARPHILPVRVVLIQDQKSINQLFPDRSDRRHLLRRYSDSAIESKTCRLVLECFAESVVRKRVNFFSARAAQGRPTAA